MQTDGKTVEFFQSPPRQILVHNDSFLRELIDVLPGLGEVTHSLDQSQASSVTLEDLYVKRPVGLCVVSEQITPPNMEMGRAPMKLVQTPEKRLVPLPELRDGHCFHSNSFL